MKLIRQFFARALLVIPLSVLGAVSAHAEVTTVKVVNSTSDYIIREFYASHTYDTKWGKDLLGSNMMYQGQTLTITFKVGDGASAECFFDLRAVTTRGREITRRNVNVCRVSTWTLDDDD